MYLVLATLYLYSFFSFFSWLWKTWIWCFSIFSIYNKLRCNFALVSCFKLPKQTQNELSFGLILIEITSYQFVLRFHLKYIGACMKVPEWKAVTVFIIWCTVSYSWKFLWANTSNVLSDKISHNSHISNNSNSNFNALFTRQARTINDSIKQLRTYLLLFFRNT